MFKNLIIYRIGTLAATFDQVEAVLQPFAECGTTQEKSSGWVPPRGEKHGALAESIGGHWVLRYMTDAFAAENLEMRTVLGGCKGLGRHVVNLFLPFLHPRDVVGK